MAAKKVIKFYATWCGPCKIYGKTWDEVVNEYEADDIEFVDINVEKDTTGLAAEYKVKSIPLTVVIDPDGTVTKENGRLSKEELLQLIK